MMKIGKLTQDGYGNYGNILQNYALQEFLLNYAEEVDSIWHTSSELLCNFWQWDIKNEIKFLLNYKGFRKAIKNGRHAWEYVRNARFYDFSQKYIHNVNPNGSLDGINEKYDFFVVGSDQVWKPTSTRLDLGFLRFASKEKRISYAASMGVTSVPEKQIDYYKTCLQEMHAISVREESAARLVESISGRECTVVMDPCFALNADKWSEMAEIPYWIPKRYMFSYFLGPTPKEIEEIARKHNLEIVKAFSKENFYHAIISPQEWIALIENADMVYTDSFHCCVFSMIFNKPFIVCDRIGNAVAQQMRTRLETLLNRFHMQDRFVTHNTHYEIPDPYMIDYSHFDSILNNEYNNADAFLKKALGRI